MIGQHFYHETIKTAVAVFGSLFNNIVIRRKDGKVIPVPIAYGPRSRWVEAQKAHDPEKEIFENPMPRMSYEMVAMNYDINRKLTNKQQVIRTPGTRDHPRQQLHVPVPYNIDFTLYITTKNLNDGWQIIEQILPFFQPAYTVKVRHFPSDADPNTPEPTNTFDMPITLTATTWADEWQGDIADRRLIEWSMEFSSKVFLYGPVAQTAIIYDSRALVATKDGVTIEGINRLDSDIVGVETGYVNSKYMKNAPETLAQKAAFDASRDINQSLSPILQDSEGYIVKYCREVDWL